MKNWTGFNGSQAPLACFIGEGHWLAGNEEQARQNLKEALDAAEKCGAKYYAGYAQRILGDSFLVNDPKQADSHYGKSIAIFKQSCLKYNINAVFKKKEMHDENVI